MPITETLEPRAPEELQLKIFATKTSEDYIIIREVCDHLGREGYESRVIQTSAKPQDVKFGSQKALVFLIMGSFMLADGKVIGEEGVKMGDLMGKVGAGKGYVVEEELGMRVFGRSAVMVSYFFD